jgi:Protein of unknown function (DUF3108)
MMIPTSLSSDLPISPRRTLLLGMLFLCALASMAIHLAFLGWLGSSTISSNASTQPLREQILEVSLAPAAASTATPTPLAQPVAKRVVRSNPTFNRAQAPAGPKVQESTAPNGAPVVVEVTPEVLSPSTNEKPLDQPNAAEVIKSVEKEPEISLIPNYFPKGAGVLPEGGAFSYRFYMGDYTENRELGVGTYFVESGDSAYKLVLVAKATGLTSFIFSGATYRSEGIFDAQGLRPKLYAEKTGNRPERAAQVDYETKRVTLGTQSVAVVAGMQDRISLTWQIGLILRAQPDLVVAGSKIPVPLMSTRSLDGGEFVSQGLESLTKPQSSTATELNIAAVHLSFKPFNPQNKAQIDLWYDVKRLPQPLRVRWIDEQLRTVDIFRDD